LKRRWKFSPRDSNFVMIDVTFQGFNERLFPPAVTKTRVSIF
jgi:hypothetical protein